MHWRRSSELHEHTRIPFTGAKLVSGSLAAVSLSTTRSPPVPYLSRRGHAHCGEHPLSGQHDMGFIAQEVEKILPEVVHEDDKGLKSIDYVRFTPLIIAAVQEQERTIEQLLSIVCLDHPEQNICVR
jgi:hypothetical protein